jgi:hypothetical protein
MEKLDQSWGTSFRRSCGVRAVRVFVFSAMQFFGVQMSKPNPFVTYLCYNYSKRLSEEKADFPRLTGHLSEMLHGLHFGFGRVEVSLLVAGQ